MAFGACADSALSPPFFSTPWYEAISLPVGWSFYTMVSSITTIHFLYVPLPLTLLLIVT